jgi:nucleotide-binding universal stress UspA family protein
MTTTEARPIICGTDLSERAAQAATVADALARRLDAPLILVHSSDERGDFPDRIQERLVADDRPRLAQYAEQLRGRGLTFQEEVIRGAPDHRVVDFAAQAGARLVVVGASGAGSLWASRWLLGDIAERIAETSTVPTLVVRDAKPFVAWTRGERPLKVFIATDFTATSEAALRWMASQWRGIGPCEITLGYIHRPAEECSEITRFDELGTARLTLQMREGLERDLREKAERLLGETPAIRVEPRLGRVDAHLLLLATEAGADLLVLGTHQWHDFQRVQHPSISRRILHDAPISVACVPVPIAPRGAAATIPTFRRVLVPTDLSEHGGHAIPYAYSALARGGLVCLCHVAEPGKAGQKSELETRLRAFVPAEADARGIATEVRISESMDTVKEICAAAERFDADLVCIGSHGGRTGLASAVMGSVARAVIAHSTCPVLVVGSPV